MQPTRIRTEIVLREEYAESDPVIETVWNRDAEKVGVYVDGNLTETHDCWTADDLDEIHQREVEDVLDRWELVPMAEEIRVTRIYPAASIAGRAER